MIKVITNRRQVKEIAKRFQVSGSTIHKALKFETQSLLARKIRCYALNKIGAFLIKL